jgi:hypothetical protein
MTSREVAAAGSYALLRYSALVVTCLCAAACDLIHDAVSDPGAPQEAELARLVREGASEAQLAKVVSAGSTYRKGTPDWTSLEAFLAREPKESFRPLREAMRAYPTIVFHTTAWRMTWVFVDASGVVRGYCLCAQ